MQIQDITKKEFETVVLGSKVPVMLVFYKDDDAACEGSIKVAEELADKLQDKVLIRKVNVDQEISLAFNYQIMNLPAYVFMSYGIFQKKMSGSIQRDELLEELNMLCEQNGTQSVQF